MVVSGGFLGSSTESGKGKGDVEARGGGDGEVGDLLPLLSLTPFYMAQLLYSDAEIDEG